MNGYLTFLKNLSESQQRAAIGRLAFTERQAGSSLEEDLLRAREVVAYSQTLGVNPRFWKLELKHYAEEADVIGTPVFSEGQCRASFTLRYVEEEDETQTLVVVRDIGDVDDLVVTGMIEVDDNRKAIIGTLAASSIREKSAARERLIELGIDPDTLQTLRHDKEMAREMPYLDYLKTLLPQQRRDAIVDLAELAWGTDNPLFLDHPKLAPELQRVGITELGISDFCHQVGPVEFAEGRCTAPILYPLYGDGKDSQYDKGGFGYYVEVHIIAGIGNKPGGGGDIWIEDLWFRIESIDDPPSDTTIPLLVF